MPHTRTMRAKVGGSHEIIIVDDEPGILKVIELWVRRWGYKPACCNTPAEAIKLTGDFPGRFSALLTDLTMPLMTGVQMAEQIHKLDPGLPMILATGYGSGVDETLLRGVGFVRTLDKPFESSALENVLREACQLRASAPPPSGVSLVNHAPRV